MTLVNNNVLNSKKNLIMFLKKNLEINKIVNFSSNLKISRIICYKRCYYESKTDRIRFTLDKNLKYKIFKRHNFISEDTSRKFSQKNFNILELKCDDKKNYLVPFVEKNMFIKNQSFSKFIDYRY